MIDLQVVIPSLGRPQVAPKAIALFHNPLLCIGESEVDLYRRFNPEVKLLVHPDSVRGLGIKRQWILDNVPNEVVFMCDDDVFRCACLVGAQNRHITNPDAIMALLRRTAHVAKEIGTRMFGYSHVADVRHFRATQPFSFTGYVNGFAMGIIGRELRFDPALNTKQDVDISLQCLLKRRILWRDVRFAFVSSNWFKNVGGNATVRTAESVVRDIETLKRKWGNAVEVTHFRKSGKGKHQNVHINVHR